MEFNEKLQELRKQRKITQQQLADAIYVSRTAISKWESGRGFPNIDSLKSIAAYFNVTVDELLSTEEAIKIADESQKQTVNNYRTLVFGFLDLGAALLLFLPLFAIRDGDIVVGGSLFFLSGMTEYIRLAFFSLIVTTVLFGCLILLAPKMRILDTGKLHVISLVLGAVCLSLFILTLQPYAAIFSFFILMIKTIFMFYRR